MFELFALMMVIGFAVMIYFATRAGPPADAPTDEAVRRDEGEKP